jgi:hypothetical protein
VGDDDDYETTEEEEEGIVVAFQHRDRVRRICLLMPFQRLKRLITAIDYESPMLEHLYVESRSSTVFQPEHNIGLILPETFQAPLRRDLVLINIVLSIRSPVLTTPASLVTLSRLLFRPSAYFPPNDFLERIL